MKTIEKIINLIEDKKKIYDKQRKVNGSLDQECYSLLNTLLWEIEYLEGQADW